MSQKEHFEKAKKVAIVRTDKIGDMILTLPLMKAIKQQYPEKKICIIAKSYTADYLKLIKDEFTTYIIEDYGNGINNIFGTVKFDVVFFPRPVFSEIFSAYMSKVPLRVGSAYRAYSFLFNHKVKDHRKISNYHEAEYNVRMLESLTGNKYRTELYKPYVSPEAVNSLYEKLPSNSLSHYIIVHPGSGGSARDLPIETLKSALIEIGASAKFKFIITGIASEMIICNTLSSSIADSVNLCGKLNLAEMVALINGCDGLIANSTGVLHIAASLKKKILGFYPNSPHISKKRWGPYNTDSIIISPPNISVDNSADDMSRISANDVVEGFRKLWLS